MALYSPPKTAPAGGASESTVMPGIRQIPAAVLLASAAVVLSAAARQPPAPPATRADGQHRLIDDLDALIQRRFEDVDERFGITRLGEPGDFHRTLRLFRPETDAERTTLDALERGGVRVVLFLAGRSLLASGPMAPAVAARAERRALGGPVLVSGAREQEIARLGLPDRPVLSEHGRRAFDAFARSGAYAFGHGAWRFEARPVRAGRQECLDCHRGIVTGTAASAPALGDALGVVFYGVRAADPDGTR